MSSNFFLGAYWSSRRESIDECADRLETFFADLVCCAPLLETWHEQGWSRKQALEKRVDVRSRTILLKLLNRGRHRNDIGREIIEDLGYSIGLWNGGEERKEASLGITCGLYTDVGLSNRVTLNLPCDLGELRRSDHMVQVLTAVAKAWEPDWAGVMSDEAMEVRNFSAAGVFIDWMVYISRELLPQIPKLPAPATIQQVGKIGSIVVVQDERPDPQNSIHLENIKRVETAIGIRH